tara:strand:+ start:2633 stop:3547 length:915 start_codon:yes stop_codon:yes gene_type:complete
MSLKQKEEITIWAFKDGKKGHEKQIEALISELAKHKTIELYNFTEYQEHDIMPDIILGAGNNSHKHMLKAKKKCPDAKTIVLMKPSLRPIQWFDIAIVPDMDKFYLCKPKNVILTKGVLSKYSDQETEKKTGLMVIGGKSRHFHFREKVVQQQIEWLLNDKFDDYQWKITTSPRSPNMPTPKHKGNAELFNWKETPEDWLSNEIQKNEITFITPESVSMLYEALSTKTKAYVFHHEKHASEHGASSTKVNKNIDKLKKDGSLGYIDTKRFFLSRSVKDIDLVHPQKNIHLKEVKRVVEELLERL